MSGEIRTSGNPSVELRVVCPVCRMLLHWLCFVACMGWVTEGQLKKKVGVIGALFGNQFACLVEGLDVELLERAKHALMLEGLEWVH